MKTNKWVFKTATVLIAMVLLFSFSGAAQAKIVQVSESNIEVLLDGRKIAFPDDKPYMEGVRVMVPIRFVNHALGGKIQYDSNNGKKVTIEKGDRKIQLTIGSQTAYVNGKAQTFDAPMVIKGIRTYVPLRFISEALGVKVNWDQGGKWVWLGEKTVPNIEDLNVKQVEIEDVKDYFKNREFFLSNPSRIAYQGAYIVDSKKDLPFRYGDFTIYDLTLLEDSSKNQAVKIRLQMDGYKYTSPTIYYVTEKKIRIRGQIKGIDRLDQSGINIPTYLVASGEDNYLNDDPDFLNFRIDEVIYVGLFLPGDMMILIKNPF
jgi:Copper amine oxidase N-terminal domain.